MDSIERYKNVKTFDGNSKEYEEFSNKLRSQIAAGDGRVAKLVESIEHDCTEEQLVKGKYDECIDENDVEFIETASAQMFNVFLNMTTGEANAMVRRCHGKGWLAWKKLTSTLNPRTLASGIKAISSVLSPGKIGQASRADTEIELWEERMSKLLT